MNPIIKGYLLKFIDEHQEYRDMQESEQFEYFVNYICIKRDFLDEFELDFVHIGGSLDNGVDGIAVIVDNELIDCLDSAKDICDKHKNISADFIFTQSKNSNKLDNGEILKFFEGVYRLFKDDDKNHGNDKILEFIKIKKLLYENAPKFSKNPNLYLKYAYNGTKENLIEVNKNIESYKARFSQLSLFADISIEIIDSNDIQNIYKEITLNVKKTIKLEKIVTIPQIEGVQESYIGIIPLQELINLVLDNNRIIKNLFYSNVRDFQGNTSVNMEIIETMKNINESKYFGLYHNGITIVAKTLKKTGDIITLENFQIVNGCQTSHIIAENRNLSSGEISKMFIPIKLVATENNHIINSIIKTTNRHNEVKIEAFESLQDFHKSLEEFYNAKNENLNPKIYYERRSKQYAYNDKIKKQHIITLAEQIKTYLSMFAEVPQSVHRYYGELLDSYRNKCNLFNKVDNKEHFELYHIAGLAFVKLNAYINHNKSYEYKRYRYHILLLFKLLIAYKLSIKSDKKYYDKSCKNIYDILGNDKLLNDYFNKCFKIIDKALERYGKFFRSIIGNRADFTNKIKDIWLNEYHTNKD